MITNIKIKEYYTKKQIKSDIIFYNINTVFDIYSYVNITTGIPIINLIIFDDK